MVARLPTLTIERACEADYRGVDDRAEMDRLWRRCLTKKLWHVVLRAKELAPRTESRNGFRTAPARRNDCGKRSSRERSPQAIAVDELADLSHRRRMPRRCGACDLERNNATVLLHILDKKRTAARSRQ